MELKLDIDTDVNEVKEAYPLTTTTSSTTTSTSTDEKVAVVELNSLQIASDLHLEFPRVYDRMKRIRKGSPILALLGDIGYPKLPLYEQFVMEMSALFDHVLIIAGNHEYYMDEYYQVNDKIQAIVEKCVKKNIYYLQNQTIEFDDILPNIRILGCTLWCDYPKECAQAYEYRVNDFRKISIIPKQIHKSKSSSLSSEKERLIKTQDINDLHNDSVSWIENELKKAIQDKKNVIVLTHHAPTNFKCVNPETLQDPISYSMNYSSLEQRLLRPPVIGWFFGHTHYNCDFLLKVPPNKNHKEDWYVRVATNQQGYLDLKERKAFDYQDCKVIVFSENHSQRQQLPIVEFDDVLNNRKEKLELIPQSYFNTPQYNANQNNQTSRCSSCILL